MKKKFIEERKLYGEKEQGNFLKNSSHLEFGDLEYSRPFSKINI